MLYTYYFAKQGNITLAGHNWIHLLLQLITLVKKYKPLSFINTKDLFSPKLDVVKYIKAHLVYHANNPVGLYFQINE